MTDFAKKIRNKKIWVDLTKEIKLRDNNLCQICLDLYKVKLLSTIKQVHHIKKIKYYPELAYTRTNLITLCSKCHKRVDLGWSFYDEKGKIIDIERLLREAVKRNEESDRRI